METASSPFPPVISKPEIPVPVSVVPRSPPPPGSPKYGTEVCGARGTRAPTCCLTQAPAEALLRLP